MANGYKLPMTIKDATDKLLKDLETSMYSGGIPRQTVSLLRLLDKLGIKSASPLTRGLSFGGPLYFEPLSITLGSVTFEDKHLKLWRKSNGT